MSNSAWPFCQACPPLRPGMQATDAVDLAAPPSLIFADSVGSIGFLNSFSFLPESHICLATVELCNVWLIYLKYRCHPAGDKPAINGRLSTGISTMLYFVNDELLISGVSTASENTIFSKLVNLFTHPLPKSVHQNTQQLASGVCSTGTPLSCHDSGLSAGLMNRSRAKGHTEHVSQ